MVPFFRNSLSWLGKPRPVSCTLPLYSDPDRYWAAAAMPTVVGEMMPLSVGWAWRSAWTSCWDFWALSSP